MTTFSYKALDKSGNEVAGTLDADKRRGKGVMIDPKRMFFVFMAIAVIATQGSTFSNSCVRVM